MSIPYHQDLVYTTCRAKPLRSIDLLDINVRSSPGFYSLRNFLFLLEISGIFEYSDDSTIRRDMCSQFQHMNPNHSERRYGVKNLTHKTVSKRNDANSVRFQTLQCGDPPSAILNFGHDTSQLLKLLPRNLVYPSNLGTSLRSGSLTFTELKFTLVVTTFDTICPLGFGWRGLPGARSSQIR